MSETIALHHDCAACLSETLCTDKAEATLTILKLLETNELEQVVADLCFAHRKQLGPVGAPDPVAT